ncbi:MAG: transcriptional repressor [Acidimicrobiales bacterium]
MTPQRLPSSLLCRATRATRFRAHRRYERVAVSMSSISLRTVYQTLNDLCALGVIGSVHLGGDALRYDLNTDEHHHLVCDACGSIADTYLDVGALQPRRRRGIRRAPDPRGAARHLSGLPQRR